MQIATFSEWRLQDFRNWSARGDLHSQGCLILSQVGLLFPVNHAPVLIANSKLQTGLPDFGNLKFALCNVQLKMAHPAGLSPANSPFEAEDDNNFTTDAKMEPMERLALSRGNARQFTKLLPSLLSHIGGKIGGLPRTCTVFRPGKSRSFTVKVCSPNAAGGRTRTAAARPVKSWPSTCCSRR